ncbi:DUF4307 domain-containing protein [Arthrobacter koreensis]|uniref:DUF4307 domain-containing protein n=1 Tax=Arthrobacter koreensis TaxID=199136 RepID=A0ABY6FW23_9MICC|nr:DUF4307 domain-containing protein [Arthrobacter koreensis]UYB36977.1 DUF4307 domain-containing protein [Arthrobacter koreensis]
MSTKDSIPDHTGDSTAGVPASERPADGLSSESRLANRYGAPKPGLSARTKIVLGSLAAAAAVGAVVFMAIPSGAGTLTSKDVGFTIPDATSAVVDFNVTKPAEATVDCAVQVLSDSYAVVGWKTVRIPPSEDPTVSLSTSVRTDSLGVTGGVNACWIVEQDS